MTKKSLPAGLIYRPVKGKQGFALPLILLIAVLIAAAGSIYFLTRPKTQSLPTPSISPSPLVSPQASTSPQADETANWNTYTNAKNRFSFKYPKSWQIAGAPNNPDAAQSDLVQLTSPCNYQGGDYCSQLNFSVGPYAEVKLFDPIFIIDPNNGYQILSKKMIKVNGADAAEEIYFQSNYGTRGGQADGILRYVLVIEHNPIKIVTTYQEQSKVLLIKTPDQWKNKKILDQILSTFKFTN